MKLKLISTELTDLSLVSAKIDNLLKRIPTPTHTKSWKPVQLYKPTRLLLEELAENNLSIKKCNITIGIEKKYAKEVEFKILQYIVNDYHISVEDLSKIQYILTEITINDSDIADKQIFIINSINKSVALNIGFGYNLKACANGMLFNTLDNFRKKHVDGIEYYIENAIADAIKFINTSGNDLLELINNYKDINLSSDQVDQIFGEALRLYPVQLVYSAFKYARSKQNLYPYNSENNTTNLWNMYNFFTEAFKKAHPLQRINLLTTLNETAIKIYNNKKWIGAFSQEATPKQN